MKMNRLAYLPLLTFPEPVSDEAILGVAKYADSMGLDLHASVFAVDIPRVSTPMGRLLINIPEMIRSTEAISQKHCGRLSELLSKEAASRGGKIRCQIKKAGWGLMGDAAAQDGRYFDLVLVPSSKDDVAAQDLAQAVVFGSGKPVILIPWQSTPQGMERVAIAWDGSRVAARALADALPFMQPATGVTVVTVKDEKALPSSGIARVLAASLEERGLTVSVNDAELRGRSIGEALQDAAIEAGADLLVMGGYGHSRLRDFVLGGATKDVFAGPRLPVLVSH